MKSNKIKKLEDKKSKVLKRLPPLTEVLRATLAKRYLTCGRSNCKCQRGQKHGPFYYLSITLGVGKTKQIQVSPEDLPVIRRWIKNYRNTRIVLEQVSLINTEILQAKKRNRSL